MINNVYLASLPQHRTWLAVSTFVN